MVWPFRSFALGDNDMKVTTALRKVAPRLSDKKLDDFFSRLFVEATKFLKGPDAPGNLDNPVLFINALRKRDSVRSWAKAISKSLFVTLFLVLRTARDNWYLNPRSPMDIQTHSKVARAIDEFNRHDTLDWSGAQITGLLIRLKERGGRIKLRNIGDEDAVMEDYPMTLAGQETAQALHGQTEAITGEVDMDKDVDMMIDGIQELAIRHR
ncbi:hypothetical protein B0I37DRAFT_38345 [Chaetomium sp. MPI-CAGE-AT-0009]|nr:hypothetical protein B0I37DRAFT_38345 [Chaetomium sp. MPI-CAGE-AT-0009]